MNPRIENKRLMNDLREERETNERMMRSQTSMDQLVELSQHRHKRKLGFGYTEQGESSQQGAQNKKKPTCNHCGELGHTSKKCWSNGKSKFNGKCYSYKKTWT